MIVAVDIEVERRRVTVEISLEKLTLRNIQMLLSKVKKCYVISPSHSAWMLVEIF